MAFPSFNRNVKSNDKVTDYFENVSVNCNKVIFQM